MLEFAIAPISVNRLYVNIPGQRRRFVSTEGRNFKKAITEIVINNIDSHANYLKSLEGKKLKQEISIVSPSWVLKDGKTIAKKDLDNLTKCLNDAIFDAFKEKGYKLDDSQIWKISLQKIVGDTKTMVVFQELDES